MMATKVSDLAELSWTGNNLADADLFAIVDDSASETKKVKLSSLVSVGSWTPTLWDSETGGAEVTSYGGNNGAYVKIGQFVYLTFRVVNFTHSFTSADIWIRDMPFAISTAANARANGPVTVAITNITDDYYLTLDYVGGQSGMRIRENRDAQNLDSLTYIEVGSGTADIFGTIMYLTD